MIISEESPSLHISDLTLKYQALTFNQRFK